MCYINVNLLLLTKVGRWAKNPTLSLHNEPTSLGELAHNLLHHLCHNHTVDRNLYWKFIDAVENYVANGEVVFSRSCQADANQFMEFLLDFCKVEGFGISLQPRLVFRNKTDGSMMVYDERFFLDPEKEEDRGLPNEVCYPTLQVSPTTESSRSLAQSVKAELEIQPVPEGQKRSAWVLDKLEQDPLLWDCLTVESLGSLPDRIIVCVQAQADLETNRNGDVVPICRSEEPMINFLTMSVKVWIRKESPSASLVPDLEQTDLNLVRTAFVYHKGSVIGVKQPVTTSFSPV